MKKRFYVLLLVVALFSGTTVPASAQNAPTEKTTLVFRDLSAQDQQSILQQVTQSLDPAGETDPATLDEKEIMFALMRKFDSWG